MKLIRLELENYRCFQRLTLDLDPRLTVLVARNGQGKSALLDALKIAIWPYVRGYDLGSTTNDVTGIHPDDVRLEAKQPHQMEPRLPVTITAVAELEGESLQWSRRRESIRKGTKTKDDKGAIGLEGHAKLHEYGVFFEEASAIEQQSDLPVLAYYGTGRLWSQKKLTAAFDKAENAEYSRTYAYRDCLDPASNYKHVAKWYTRVFRTYREEQIRNLERGHSSAELRAEIVAPVQAVQAAVNAILEAHTGWKNLAYSSEFAELALEHDDHGLLKVSQLSDGIRNMLALVADIAYRCVKLNPHLGREAVRTTTGIVLIDEVDMHLHPAWQQTVLPDLRKAFPAIQFIVSTHSPQVLTTVPAECIRILASERDERSGQQRTVIQRVHQQTEGLASSDVMAEVMGIDPIPDIEWARKLSQYKALIEQDLQENDDGLSLRVQLDAHFGVQHWAMLDCDRLIRLREFKRRLPERLSDKARNKD